MTVDLILYCFDILLCMKKVSGMSTMETPEDFYRYLRDSKTKLVANIIFGGSPGHQIHELDYFLRKYKCGDIPRDSQYLWIQKKSQITSDLAEIFGDHFRQYNLGMLIHDNYFDMSCQICRMIPELGIDVGLSHFKNSIDSRKDIFLTNLGGQLYYNVTNNAVVNAIADHHRTRSLTEDFNPWALGMPSISEELSEFLGGDITRLATIHFRTGYGNAGTVIPPENLFSSLAYLRDKGFTIVKVGTEPYPKEFEKFDVVNYSESSFRTFRNDMSIVGNSKINIINASGLENISDVMGIPTVSYARWHLNLTPYSGKFVIVPTLLFDPSRNRLLNFAEQMLFFKTRQEWWEGKFFGWHFPVDRFTARPPEADELLAAVQEALDLEHCDRDLSPMQISINKLDEFGALPKSRSRISQFFLDRWSQLL